MIYLKRDTINECVISITSNLLDTTPLPYFIFEIIEGNTGELVKYFTSENVSPSRRRYDEFNLELVDEINEDLTDGKIYLPEGTHSYEYRCYITSVEGSIDPLNIISDIVHSGKLIVEHTTTNDLYD